MLISGPQTNIVILGAGKGGTALLESLHHLPRICIMGIADEGRSNNKALSKKDRAL